MSDIPAPPPLTIAGHTAQFDAQGQLLPWTAWTDALDRQMQFYQQCPADRGYPRFAYVTFLDREWIMEMHEIRTIKKRALQSFKCLLSI